MKKSKGITLIALVITIIVLLILAGVSISLVIGDNGVLIKATNSVEANRDAKAKEEVELAWAGATADYWSDWAVDSSTNLNEDFYTSKLNDYLVDTKKEDVDVTDMHNGTYEVYYVTKDQGTAYTFTMDGNGKATMTGSATAGSIRYLANAVEIGDYVDIGIDYNNMSGAYGSGTVSLKGWRVISVTPGRKGVIKLISAGSPLKYSNSSDSNGTDTINNLNNLYLSDVSGKFGNGLKDNTGTVNNNLQTVFNNPNACIDISKGVHAFSCKKMWDGTEVEGANDELGLLYKELTGNDLNMKESSGTYLSNTNLGLTTTSKTYNLIVNGGDCFLGGALMNSRYPWYINKDGSAGNSSNGGVSGTFRVRPVVTLQSGVRIADDNTGDGSSSTSAYKITK